MTLVTLFSAPKPFTDPVTAASQRNAIRSWQQLSGADVLLLGDEPGLAQAAADIGVAHRADVQRNPGGVPLISSMLQLARASGASRFLCIINADIILLSDFMRVAERIAALQDSGRLGGPFVLLGRRWDLDVPAPIDFTADWEPRIRAAVQQRGVLHKPAGSDYFLFPREAYGSVPDFAIGRAGWDNWMIYKARRAGWPVIDATPSLLVIHQNHDYRHLPGGRPHYDHPDTARNTRLAGGLAATRYTIVDATHLLVDGGLKRPALSRLRFLRAVELFLRRIFFFLPEGALENIARPRRWSRRLRNLFGRTGS